MTNKCIVFQISRLVMIMSISPEYVARKGNKKCCPADVMFTNLLNFGVSDFRFFFKRNASILPTL